MKKNNFTVSQGFLQIIDSKEQTRQVLADFVFKVCISNHPPKKRKKKKGPSRKQKKDTLFLCSQSPQITSPWFGLTVCDICSCLFKYFSQ